MRSVAFLLVVVLSACSSLSARHAPPAGGTRLLVDPFGHVIAAIPEKAPAQVTSTVSPSGSVTTGAPTPGLGVLSAPSSTPQVGVPGDLRRQGNFASNLMAEPFTRVEDIDQGRAGKKHFFVLPAGVNGEVASTDISVHTVPKDQLDRRQPLLAASPDAWRARTPAAAPVAASLPLSDWRPPLQSWRRKNFTRAKSGLEINLGPDDERWLSVAGHTYMALGVALLPRKRPSPAEREVKIFEYENVGCDKCLFTPTLLALDAKSQPLGVYRGFFDLYRPGGRFSFAGWRGQLQVPAATQRLLIVDERPLPPLVPRHLPTFSVEYAQ